MNKQNKGITLVALVITIIVLIILAAVSINAVMNDGLIKNAKTAAGNYDEEKIKETISLAYYTAFAEGKGDVTAGNLQAELAESQITADVNENDDGTFTVTVGEVTYTVDKNGNVTKSDVPSSSVAQWSLPTGDTEVNVGDLLTPTVTGLENEKFYVIADDGTTLTLLAERCIDTNTNKQVSSSFSTVAFDDDSNVYNGSTIQGLVNTYVGTLTGLDLEDVEVAYGANPVTGVKGRLMWYEEATNTTFQAATNYSDILYGPSTARVNYWLGSPDEDDAGYTLVVDGLGGYLYGYDVVIDNFFGLRPVIKILKSNV